MQFLTTALNSLKPRLDDDFVERINYYYTSTMLIVFGMLVSAQQWVGQPIECWVPAYYKHPWEEYAENYCFVQNTYWQKTFDQIPQELGQRKEKQLGYYQWTPFILALQALMFYCPYALWAACSSQTGIDVHSMVTMGNNITKFSSDEQTSSVKSLSAFIIETLKIQREMSHRAKKLFRRVYGQYVCLFHLLVKFLFFANAIGQIFLIGAILGPHRENYGFGILLDLLQGKEWPESGNFPRVTLCDLEVRELGNLHRHTIQCVLIINMFNEKIFFICWLWFACLSVMNLVNFLYWVNLTIRPHQHLDLVNKYVCCHMTEVESNEMKADLTSFAFQFLQPDGVFLVRKLGDHSGDFVTAKVVSDVFHFFKKEQWDLSPKSA